MVPFLLSFSFFFLKLRDFPNQLAVTVVVRMKVAITGGGGIVGRYVTERLLQRNDVEKIVIVDREEPTAPVSHDEKVDIIICDVNNEELLVKALTGCHAVIHCVHAPFPFFYPNEEEREQMKKDNQDAVTSVVKVMESLSIRAMVFVSSAYTPIPIEDNYGLGSEAFTEFPRNYMLDAYGETRTKGEFAALEASSNGVIDVISLRPSLIYGEGGSRFMSTLVNLTKSGKIPYIEGDRRGMHQFIYAGNLAVAIEKALIGIYSRPDQFRNETVFCLDETGAFSFRQFLERKVPEYSDRASSYWPAFLSSYYNYIKYKLGLTVEKGELNHVMFRLLFEKTVGFSNKKYRLFLDCKPEITQEEAFARYGNADNSVCGNNNSPNSPDLQINNN